MDQHIIELALKRSRLLNLTKEVSNAQYNLIPLGFNNNIIWNIGHLIVFSENLLYEKSGLSLPDHYLSLKKFHMGTIPKGDIEKEEIAYLRDLYMNSFNIFAADLSNIKGSHTASQDDLKIDERIMNFLLFHEDQHYQRVYALMKTMKIRTE
jgi:hypothetical protein